MNAEFLEQKIVVKIDTTGQELASTISPAEVRKGLHPGSFIGAEVNILVNGDLAAAASITSAAVVDGKVVLSFVNNDNDQKLLYDPKTGELGVIDRPESDGHVTN